MSEGNGWWSATPKPFWPCNGNISLCPNSLGSATNIFSIKMTAASRCCQTCYMAAIIPEHFVPFHCSVQFILHIHIFNNILRTFSCRMEHWTFWKDFFCFIIQGVCLFSPQEQFEFALTAVAEEVNAILKALPQWAAQPPEGSCRIHPSFSPHLQSLWMFLETVTWPYLCIFCCNHIVIGSLQTPLAGKSSTVKMCFLFFGV